MNELYLIPKDGVTVRDPVTGLAVPASGAAKPRTAYWLRRLRDGDVQQGEPPKASAAAAAATSEAQRLADAEAAIKKAEAALDASSSSGSQAAAQTTTSTKGAAK